MSKFFGPPCVMGDESIMAKKKFGSSDVPVQANLRWNCDRAKADEICNYNRHYAEYSGYFETTTFKEEARRANDPMKFYDSNTGNLLFTAPIGRTMDDFLVESSAHGWPSFRDAEVLSLIHI